MSDHSTTASGPQDDQDPLDQVLLEYWETAEAEGEPDPERFIARHPAHAADLREFFADRQAFDRIAQPFSPPARAAERPCSQAGGRTIHRDTAALAAQPAPRLVGGYELLDEIARGGMGVVFRARQLGLGRIVALKMILAGRLASSEEVRRFIVEAENAARLDHPNIVPVYEVGKHEGQPYFTMKLVEGGSLSQHVSRLAQDPRAAAALVRTVAGAVHHAHERGVLHRDLKPANILLDRDGTPLVTDFGLARWLNAESDLTVAGAVIGTPRYMPPEQARAGQALTTAADVYSLGAVLYELLTAKPPFSGETPTAVLERASLAPPQRPSAVNRRIDRDLETVCLKCLEKDPAQRYPSAQALADDLAAWLAGEPIIARPAGPGRRLVRWCRRSPVVASLAASVVALLIILAVGAAITALRFARSAERERRLARTAEERLAEGLLSAGDGLWRAKRHPQARAAYRDALQIARRLGLPQTPALAGVLGSMESGPPPLQGPEGASGPPGGFEWTGTDVVARLRKVNGVAFIPGSRLAVCACEDGGVRLWDLRTGLLVRTFVGHSAGAGCVAVSADGRTAVSGGDDGMIRAWDLEGGGCTFTSPSLGGRVRGVAVFGDGKEALAACEDGVIRRWDLVGGKLLAELHGHVGPVRSVAVAADGRGAVSGSDDETMRLWDLTTGRQRREFNSRTQGVRGVAISPDGRTALASSNVVVHWDLASGAVLTVFTGHSNIPWCAAFGPNGTAVSGGADRTVRLWQLRTGRELRTFAGHAEIVVALSVSDDGRVALSGGPEECLRLWPLHKSGILTWRGHGAAVRGVCFSADGRLALSCSHDRALNLWDVATGQVLRRFTGHGREVVGAGLSPDARYAVSACDDSTIAVWDIASGRRLREIGPHGKRFIATMALSPDGRTVASGGADGLVKLWDVQSGRELRALKGHHPGAVRAVAFAPDGRSLLSGGDDRTVRQWDAASGQQILRLDGHEEVVWAVAFSPDGRSALSGSGDKSVKHWDLPTGTEIRSLAGHDHFVSAVSFSPDGRLAMSGSWDRSLRVWDLSGGKEVWHSGGHPSTIGAVGFSPDGSKALAAVYDGTLRFHDLSAPDEHHDSGAALAAARAALRRDPSDPRTLATFGRWYAARGMHEWAADFLVRARRGGAQVSSLELARCRWMAGDLAAAHSEFARARQQQEAPPEYLDLCLGATKPR